MRPRRPGRRHGLTATPASPRFKSLFRTGLSPRSQQRPRSCLRIHHHGHPPSSQGRRTADRCNRLICMHSRASAIEIACSFVTPTGKQQATTARPPISRLSDPFRFASAAATSTANVSPAAKRDAPETPYPNTRAKIRSTCARCSFASIAASSSAAETRRATSGSASRLSRKDRPSGVPSLSHVAIAHRCTIA